MCLVLTLAVLRVSCYGSALRCPVLTEAVLRVLSYGSAVHCYAVSGTEAGYGATRRPEPAAAREREARVQ